VHRYFMFFFSCSGDPRDLHSFPTRRSSDLMVTTPMPVRRATSIMPPLTIRRGPRGPSTVIVGKCPESMMPTSCSRACSPPRELRSEEHTSELQSRENLVCRLLLEKKKNKKT